MTSLKHLALSVDYSYMESERLSPLLQAMPCLQTLQLSQSTYDQCHSHRRPKGSLVVPASVRRLELSQFYPMSLELLSGGTVVLMSGTLCCMSHGFMRWSSVRGQIKGVCLAHAPLGWDKCFSETVPGLWRSVEVLQMRGVYGRNLHGLPDVSTPFLTTLCIKDHNLCVHIPARSTLRDVRIECSEVLCIKFEDAAVTARHVAIFEATFKRTCEVSTLKGFCETMRDSRKEIMVEVYYAARHIDQHVYFLHYGQPVVVEGWARLFSGCCCEGCVSGSECFPEAGAIFGGVTRNNWAGYDHVDMVAIDAGLLEETLNVQETRCLCGTLS